MLSHVGVVVPVFDNLETLPELHDRLVSVLETIGAAWSILYVDDASRDFSWQWIVEASQRTEIAGLRLNLNRGQSVAVATGFGVLAERASVVAAIDADLDYRPEELPALLRALTGPGSVALGVRHREMSNRPVDRVSSALFNTLLQFVASDRVGDVGCGYFAMNADVARQTADAGSAVFGIRSLMQQLADNVAAVPVTYQSAVSRTPWTMRLRIAFDLVAADGRPARRLGLLAVATTLVTISRRRLKAPWAVAATIFATGTGALTAHRSHLSNSGPVSFEPAGWAADTSQKGAQPCAR